MTTLTIEEINELVAQAKTAADKEFTDKLERSTFVYGATWMLMKLNKLLYKRGKEENNG